MHAVLSANDQREIVKIVSAKDERLGDKLDMFLTETPLERTLRSGLAELKTEVVSMRKQVMTLAIVALVLQAALVLTSVSLTAPGFALVTQGSQ